MGNPPFLGGPRIRPFRLTDGIAVRANGPWRELRVGAGLVRFMRIDRLPSRSLLTVLRM